MNVNSSIGALGFEGENPISRLFHFQKLAREANDPMTNRCFLATMDDGNFPQLRTLTIRGISQEGIDIVINRYSPKYNELVSTRVFQLLIHWPLVSIQYRLSGNFYFLTPEDSKIYWDLKQDSSKLSDHIYSDEFRQSSPIEDRSKIYKIREGVKDKLKKISDIPPSKGFLVMRIVPERIEAWKQSHQDRIHNRIICTRNDEGWSYQELVP